MVGERLLNAPDPIKSLSPACPSNGQAACPFRSQFCVDLLQVRQAFGSLDPFFAISLAWAATDVVIALHNAVGLELWTKTTLMPTYSGPSIL